MGWTSKTALCYKDNGKVDVKAEMDNYFTYETEKVICKVIKSSLVSTRYYGAVETIYKETGKKEVWCAVALTSTTDDNGFNFGYKPMCEEVMPFYFECPLSILKLLTPTDNENANEWRRRCIEYRKEPKLKDIKIGEQIKCMVGNKELILTKMPPNRQFKRNWWYCSEHNTYVPSKHIKEWTKVTK